MSTRSTPAADQRYRSLLEQHPDGVYEFDLQGRFVAGNDALAELTGYRVQDLIGETFLDVLHPDDAPVASAEFRATLAGQTRDYRARVRRRGGGIVHIDVTNVPIVLDGEVVGVYGIARDVGPTLAAQQALQRSEARFRQMFEAAGVGVAIMTLSGAFVRANHAFLDMTGHDQEDLTSRDLWDLIHVEDHARLTESLRLLRETERPSVAVQTRYWHHDGHTIWLRSSLTLLEWSDDLPPYLMATTEDVTSLRTTDERLEQTRSLVRMAGNVAHLGGWRLDLATGTMQWSPEIHDVLGVPLGDPPTLAGSLAGYPEEDRSRVEAALEACAEQGTPFDLEVEVVPRPPQRMWIRVIGEPERDHSGRVVGVRGAVQDIDQYKRAEQETRELAERLTDAFESMTDAVLMLDGSWRITYANTRATELMQRGRTRLLGHTLWDAFPGLCGTTVEKVYRRVAETGVAETIEEYHYAPLDAWFELNAYPAATGVTVYFRDVTAQREARRQLREREARLRQQARLLDSARDAIVVRDADDRITYWNHSAERLYGWSEQEALGRHVRDLLYRDVDAHEAARAATFATGGWTGELTHLDRTGNEVLVEARLTLVHDEDTGTPSVLAINTDVTERRRLENRFLQAQRMESLGTLASGIAHDLNNALSPVLMATQLLRDDETDPDRAGLLATIHDSAQRGADMVQQVLSFARGIDGSRVPVDLSTTVDELARLVRDTFPKNIELRPNVAPDLWPVVGDPTQLHQVLLNLCVNARDAMPGGGTLNLALSNLVLEGQGSGPGQGLEPGAYVRVTVTDTGEGMSHEVLDRVFEPFYTTKSQESGTGLGLSTSLGIVESHGGAIQAHSRPGIGSIFTIDLPATPTATRSTPHDAPATPTGNGELVLLVDDEPTVRHLASRILQRAGYRVVTATDGLDALERAHPHHDELALLVTDMMMPHMDGATTIEHLRRSHPDLPVVAISGLRAELELEAKPLGAVHLLRKPFTSPELLDVVAAALARRASS